MTSVNLLTILGYERNATVYDDGDVVSAELLVFKVVPFPSRSLLDVCIPQGEIGPAHALEMESPAGTVIMF